MSVLRGVQGYFGAITGFVRILGLHRGCMPNCHSIFVCTPPPSMEFVVPESRSISCFALLPILFVVANSGQARADALAEALATVHTASPVAATGDNIRAAWRTLAEADATNIPRILRAMEGANPAAENWLRAATDAIASRTLATGSRLPEAELTKLVEDTNAPPRGRRVAFELLQRIDTENAQRLLGGLVNDPSLEIRYDAIAQGIEAAEAAADESQGLQTLMNLFAAARELEQIETIKELLEESGQQIDLAAHMGFVTNWRMVGPFDNAEGGGFEVAYPPENVIDLSAKYDGKEGPVGWHETVLYTDDELGEVDVTETFGPVKGAVVYAYAELESSAALPAEIRYASKNATKLWLNGEMIAANEVYHSGGAVDQYVTPVRLEKGVNALLLKVCQNEQTEPWAQDWSFQLRVTDSLGGRLELINTTE